jgi:hypothetical protein
MVRSRNIDWLRHLRSNPVGNVARSRIDHAEVADDAGGLHPIHLHSAMAIPSEFDRTRPNQTVEPLLTDFSKV